METYIVKLMSGSVEKVKAICLIKERGFLTFYDYGIVTSYAPSEWLTVHRK